MTTNCVFPLNSWRAPQKRPTLLSSSAASTSSRTQNGGGLVSMSAKRRAAAVSARSPPDMTPAFVMRLTGGVHSVVAGARTDRALSLPTNDCYSSRSQPISGRVTMRRDEAQTLVAVRGAVRRVSLMRHSSSSAAGTRLSTESPLTAQCRWILRPTLSRGPAPRDCRSRRSKRSLCTWPCLVSQRR